MGIICSLNANPRLASVHSALNHRARGVLTRNVTVAIRRLPTAPCIERAHMSRDETFARQRTLVGGSMNDKQWNEDLFNPWYTILRKHEPESEG